MAEEKNPGNPEIINHFSKGLVKDSSDSLQPEGTYFHARNAVNNSHDGNMFIISNEPSNKHCLDLPYTYIGSAPTGENDEWVIFSTDDTNSEIGLFQDTACTYTTIVNDPCLNFRKSNLITAVCRRTFDCSIKVYWDDARNPSRVMDINNPPFVKQASTTGDCITYTNTTDLDCEQLRLAPIINIPCLSLLKAKGSGLLKNGTYQVVMAYAVNQIKVTDYLALSNPIGIFDHSGVAGAVELNISGVVDPDYDEMEIVVISTVAGQTVAKRLGIYSTRQTNIYIDHVADDLVTIPLSLVPIQSQPIEKSDAMYAVGDYLIRTGIYSKPDFNYQPLANQIIAKWVTETLPADYYHKGGEKVGYMRGEVYPFFIRWIYNTGEKSASYHIPGRPSGATASNMEFWESTEKYPDNQFNIWGNLCGQKIRHHKFPDNTVTNHFNNGGDTINILGIKFEGIKHPLDNDSQPITSIVGYEILRGSREGNKSIVAKGMINNMREYTVPGSSQKGLFQNYPHNQLSGDEYYTTPATHKTDYLSFHSPDTSFRNPNIGSPTLEVYQSISGKAYGSFETAYKHPQFRVLSDLSNTVSTIVGVVTTVTSVLGSLMGTNLTLAATEDVPMAVPVNVNPFIPDGPFGALATAFTAISIAANATATIGMMPITSNATKQKVIDLITGLVPHRQYAAQYNSHGFYSNSSSNKFTRTVDDYGYIKSGLQHFDGMRVNNLYRNDYVLLKTTTGIPDLSGDNSRFTIVSKNTTLGTEVDSDVSAYYGALRVDLPAQYGQLESIRQIPISCIYETTPAVGITHSSPDLFGGDIYINAYTEKNPHLFFNDWLIDVAKDFQYDYRNYYNLPEPKFWVDNRKAYHGIFDNITNYRSLDGEQASTGIFGLQGFYIQEGWFYLSCNGVRHFFVESEVNVAYRDWEDTIDKRFYDPYGFTDLSLLFRSDNIKAPSFHKYDYSLSVSRFYNQFISWGSILPRDFDPDVSESCYAYYPRRVAYSLPQSEELKRDNWQSFLPNNYKDFSSKVVSMRSLGKSGAIIMLERESPIFINGVDTLQTDAGTKITVGDGGLFNQPLQNISNADKSFEYGSCQSRQAVLSTPAGIFWVSQNQGKIFTYAGNGIEEISQHGNKWWFSEYLPCQLLEAFPDYPYYDNPVKGVGLMIGYDNTNGVLYISKKDYKPLNDQITYSTQYGLNLNTTSVELSNPVFFEDVSWTMSYDVKSKQWVSPHDWHPDSIICTKDHFVTIKSTGLWKHNQRTDSFCNFYGTDYPFEVGFSANTGTDVVTLRGVEYYLECYEYKANGRDKFHILDQNFDRAIVFNSEQMSGLLKLTPRLKNNPLQLIQYPQYGLNGVDILISKEEQKYRFNQFVDLTKDRGEFDVNTRTHMFLTKGNGYEFEINPLYIDYQKSPLQRKKFRHYNQKIWMQKKLSGSTKMYFKLNKSKVHLSQR